MSRTISRKLSSQGQVTIPVSIREQLGVTAGDQILFITSDDGEIRLSKRRLLSAAELSGILGSPGFQTSDDLDAEIDAAMAEDLDRKIARWGMV